MKTYDISRKKKLAEVESEMEVEYWIGGTTGETGFHTILCARCYPRGDPGKKFGNLTTDHQTQVRLFIPN